MGYEKKLLYLFLTLSSLLMPFLLPAIQVQDDCPYGIKNDTYPGKCPRYIDTDGDGICDHSQPPPEDNSSSAGREKINDGAINKLIVTFSIAVVAILFAEIIARKKKAIITYTWNIILLTLFIVSALSGVLLEFIRDLTWITIHTVASLLFLWVGIYHVIKHAKYYVRKLKRKNVDNK